MSHKRNVSLCMIVKNEEKFIEKCLTSVQDIVNEIIVVDTGSTDKTVEIAKKFGAKIYFFEWNDNFSDARNFSIGKATGKWILLMDADEVFEKSGREAFMDYIQNSKAHGCHFTIINYIGNGKSGRYTLHNALRLLRNNGLYRFQGRIQEQVCRKDGGVIAAGLFDLKDIRLYHYGYMDEAVKDKRKRNFPIFLKELEDDPDNPFIQFHLGNEYMAASDYKNAVLFYDKAYVNMDKTQAYALHLVYRRAMAYYNLKKYAQSVNAIAEALAIYPKCTDLELLRGTVYSEWGRYTLAIDSFNRCIQMGDPPPTMKFVEDSSLIRPLLSLGDLYVRLCDYEKALKYYTQAIVQDRSFYQTLYSIGHVLNLMYEEKQTAVAKLTAFFSDLDTPNLIVLTDILIREKLYAYGVVYWDSIAEQSEYEQDKDFLRAKLYFYMQEYEKAFDLFEPLANAQVTGSVLQNIRGESIEYLYILSLILENKRTEECICLAENCCDELTARTFRQLWNIYQDNGEIVFKENEDWNAVLNEVTTIFDRVIRVQEFELFEKLLYVLNDINSPMVLTALAGVYFVNGYDALAANQVVRSVKELNYLDAAGLDILLRTNRK
nr:glycosyltransferase [uncultured Caproiciproducens sp.]